MNKEAFIYCWTDTKRNMLYVGTHKGTADDGYVCSGKLMLEEYKKRPYDFSREIIAFGTYTDMINFETKILKAANAATDMSFYNQHNGDGDFFNKGHTEGTRAKLKISRNKRIDKPRLGIPLSEEGKVNASNAAKKAAKTDGREKRLIENRGRGVDYSLLMKEVWRKRREGLLPTPIRNRGT